MKVRVARGCHSCGVCENFILPGQSYAVSGRGKIHKSPCCEKAGTVTTSYQDKGGMKHALPRMLWSSVHKSREDRLCWDCNRNPDISDDNSDWIFEGEQYMREVWVVQAGEFWEKRTRIEVRCKHYPECPLPNDPDDDPRSKSLGLSEDLPLAA